MGSIPISIGVEPQESMPEKTAYLSISPEGRVSLATPISPSPMKLEKASENFKISWGVRLCPTIPLIPEMLIFKSDILKFRSFL